jgi:hypothetical protein
MYTVFMSEEPHLDLVDYNVEPVDKWLLIYRDLIVCQSADEENWCDLKADFGLDNGDYFLAMDAEHELNRVVKQITKSVAQLERSIDDDRAFQRVAKLPFREVRVRQTENQIRIRFKDE